MPLTDTQKNKICPIRQKNSTSKNSMYHCPHCGEMVLGAVDTWPLCLKKHYCPDWDGLEIDANSPEFENCLCFVTDNANVND